MVLLLWHPAPVTVDAPLAHVVLVPVVTVYVVPQVWGKPNIIHNLEIRIFKDEYDFRNGR